MTVRFVDITSCSLLQRTQPSPVPSITVSSKQDAVQSVWHMENEKMIYVFPLLLQESQKPPVVVRRPQRGNGILSVTLNKWYLLHGTGQKNNPERLSFIERLQLHEKAVKGEAEAAKKLSMNRSSSASTINVNPGSLRALQKKFAASSDSLDGNVTGFILVQWYNMCNPLQM